MWRRDVVEEFDTFLYASAVFTPSSELQILDFNVITVNEQKVHVDSVINIVLRRG